MKFRWFWLAAVTASTSANAADQFDLICQGQVQENPLSSRAAPITRTYHIDVAAQRWCEDYEYLGKTYKCSVVQPIVSATPDRITFRDVDEKNGFGKSTKRDLEYVNRADGHYAIFEIDRVIHYYRNETGQCTPAAFTGLPKPAF